MLHTATPPSDFYSLLQIPRDASPSDVKIAYHRTLLRLHPDKLSQACRHADGVRVIAINATTDSNPSSPRAAEASVDVALLKEAYKTLSDAGLRAAYDDALRREEYARSCGPRPAQVVSLEEFTAVIEIVEAGSAAGTAMEPDSQEWWWHRCRCGGMHRITQDDLENGTHLVSCESCSEVIWVGYEEAPTMGEGE